MLDQEISKKNDGKYVLTFQQRKDRFVTAVGEFKEKKLTIEQLISLAFELQQNPVSTDSPEETELKEIIYHCTEIAYYLYQIPEVDVDGSITMSFFLDVMNYYARNTPKR